MNFLEALKQELDAKRRATVRMLAGNSVDEADWLRFVAAVGLEADEEDLAWYRDLFKEETK